MSGLRIGVLTDAEREFFGDKEVEALYDQAIERARALGATIVPFDYAPFREAAALLYDGPWVAERLAAVETFLATNAADFDPTVRGIIEGAKGKTAVEAFNGRYRLEELRRKTEAEWEKADVLLLPTAPTTYTVADMLANPVVLNGRLGRFTNFVNLLDCAAIAVPGLASAKVGCRAALPSLHLPSPTTRWRRLPMRCTAQQAPAWASTGRQRSPKQAVLCLAMTVSSKSRSSVRI